MVVIVEKYTFCINYRKYRPYYCLLQKIICIIDATRSKGVTKMSMLMNKNIYAYFNFISLYDKVYLGYT